MKRLLLTGVLLFLVVSHHQAIDFIQGVARAFVLDMPALSASDGTTPQTGVTVSSFTVNAYKKDNKVVPITIAACVYSTQTLTSTGTNPGNNDTLTIGGLVYTFKTTLTGAAYEIKIEASAAVTLDSVKCAINDTGCVEGTNYGTGTAPHPTVNATTNTNTTQVVQANIPGSAQNLMGTTDSGAQLSWGGTTLTGGTDNCMIHDANGYYWFAAPATLFDTYGDIKLTFNASGVAPFMQLGKVVALISDQANVQGNISTALGVWDLLCADADLANSVGKRICDNVDTTTSSRATPGDVAGGLQEGNAQAGANTTVTLAVTASTQDDIYNRKIVTLEAGTGAGQEAVITDYVGSTRVATIWNPAKPDGTWHVNPASGTSYVVKTGAIGSLGAPLTEPTQTTPPISPTPEQVMGYHWGTIRNRVDEDAATKKFYNDAGTVTWKKTRSAAGNVKTDAEAVAGP